MMLVYSKKTEREVNISRSATKPVPASTSSRAAVDQRREEMEPFQKKELTRSGPIEIRHVNHRSVIRMDLGPVQEVSVQSFWTHLQWRVVRCTAAKNRHMQTQKHGVAVFSVKPMRPYSSRG